MLGQPTQTGSGKLNLRSGVDLYFVVLGLQSNHTERKRHKNYDISELSAQINLDDPLV